MNSWDFLGYYVGIIVMLGFINYKLGRIQKILEDEE